VLLLKGVAIEVRGGLNEGVSRLTVPVNRVGTEKNTSLFIEDTFPLLDEGCEFGLQRMGGILEVQRQNHDQQPRQSGHRDPGTKQKPAQMGDPRAQGGGLLDLDPDSAPELETGVELPQGAGQLGCPAKGAKFLTTPGAAREVFFEGRPFLRSQLIIQ